MAQGEGAEMTTHWSQIKTEMLVTSDDRMRALQPDRVEQMVESFRDIGQLQPILVFANRNAAAVAAAGGHYTLIAGLHRLEAAKNLGKGILARITNDLRSAEKSKLAEIAENLHRAELTALERSEQIAEWIRITNKMEQSAQVVPKGPVGHRPQSGTKKAERELGLARMEGQRATNIAGLSAEAKKVAIECGLADNKSALLRAAREDPKMQSATIAKIAADKAQPYTRPADKYFAAQEAKLGPVAAPTPKISDAIRKALVAHKSALISWGRQHQDSGIPEVVAAFAGVLAVVERHLA
jgi:ParB/RepB/Spo0J family partition protein